MSSITQFTGYFPKETSFTSLKLFEENGIVGLKERVLQQANMDNSMLQIPTGAGEGSRTPYVHFGKVAFYR